MSSSKPRIPALALSTTSATAVAETMQTSSRINQNARRQKYVSLLTLSFFALTLILVFLPLAITAADPPAPQPANSGGTPTDAAAPVPGGSPAKIDPNSKPTVVPTASLEIGSSTVTEAPPQPTIITTVTVISGTSTTVTITVTPAAGNPSSPATSSLPKAPQSIIIVQGTPYGKVLPAAGPINDEIESHFWDQYVPRDGDTKSSASSTISKNAIIRWRRSLSFSLFSVHSALWTICITVILGVI
ncbi:hypothetical protein FBU30_009475 [Linnemannia zychae]|nr:hypothetical protein FBU30_009475 [Linnemannia zychae]